MLIGTDPPELTSTSGRLLRGLDRWLRKPSLFSVWGEHAGEAPGRWSGAYVMGISRSLRGKSRAALPHEAWWLLCKCAGESRPLYFCSQILGNIEKFGKGNNLLRLLDVKWRWKPAGRFLIFHEVKTAGLPEPG